MQELAYLISGSDMKYEDPIFVNTEILEFKKRTVDNIKLVFDKLKARSDLMKHLSYCKYICDIFVSKGLLGLRTTSVVIVKNNEPQYTNVYELLLELLHNPNIIYCDMADSFYDQNTSTLTSGGIKWVKKYQDEGNMLIAFKEGKVYSDLTSIDLEEVEFDSIFFDSKFKRFVGEIPNDIRSALIELINAYSKNAIVEFEYPIEFENFLRYLNDLDNYKDNYVAKGAEKIVFELPNGYLAKMGSGLGREYLIGNYAYPSNLVPHYPCRWGAGVIVCEFIKGNVLEGIRGYDSDILIIESVFKLSCELILLGLNANDVNSGNIVRTLSGNYVNIDLSDFTYDGRLMIPNTISRIFEVPNCFMTRKFKETVDESQIDDFVSNIRDSLFTKFLKAHG